MKRAWLSVIFIPLTLGMISIALLLTSETALQWLLPRVASWTGGEMSIGQVRGRLIGPISMSDVEYRSKAFNARADSLSLDWRPRWLLGGTLHLRPVRAEHVVITLPPATSTASTSSVAVRLPLRIALREAEITRLEIIGPTGAPVHIDRVQFSLALFGNQAQFDSLRIDTPVASAEISGQFGLNAKAPIDLKVRATWRPAGSPPLAAEGHVHGDRQKLKLTAQVSAPFTGRINATLDDPGPGLRWQAVMEVEELAARRIDPDWPAVQLEGRLEGQGGLAQLQVQGGLLARGALDVKAQVRFALERRPPADTGKNTTSRRPSPLADYTMALDVDWQSSPAAARAGLRSHSGQLSLRGVPDRYHFNLDARLDHAQWQAMDIKAKGTGDTASLRASAHARLLEGTLDASGAWRWSQKPDWRLQLRAKNINPARYHSGWPGRVSLVADLHGDNQRLRLDKATLAGTLRDQPLHLTTSLALQGRRLTLEHLSAHLGSGTADVSGGVGERYDVTWDIKVPDLWQVLPEARGGLSTHGRLTGSRNAPRVNARLQGSGLALFGYRARRLTLRLDLDIQDKQDSSAQLALDEFSAPQGKLSAMRLQAAGRLNGHDIDLALDIGDTHAQARWHGAYLKQVWTGMLTAGELSSKSADSWRLEAPATLIAGKNMIRMGTTCLSRNPGQVCAQGDWRRAGPWEATASLRQFPLSLVQPLFLRDIGLTGKLDADLVARAPANSPLAATVDLRFAPGSVQYPATGTQLVQVDYETASLHLQAAEGRAQSRIGLLLRNQSTLDAKLTFPLHLPNTPAPADASLQGNIQAAFHDLSLLALFFPQLYQTRGRIDTHWQLAGTLERPRLSGHLTLKDGAVDIPRLGIQLRETRVSLKGNGSDTLSVTGHMQSGKGTLDLDGDIDLRDGDTWAAALRLRGNQFELANTPEIFLLATPDLTLDARPHTLRLDGRIDLPTGRIAPKDLARAKLSSSDVMIVGTDTSSTAPAKWKIYSRVQFNLGEKIHFSGFNFKGDITGNIITADEPDRPTTALGELRVVKGQYSIYRQDLAIERGRLIFASGPIDNPGLDMRAVRRTGDVLAGVQARGTLKSPELTLFSEPGMSDTDALSYLMLGRPADQAGRADGELLYQAATSLGAAGGELLAKKIGTKFGIEEVTIQTGTAPQDTALIIGKYLSPRLYVNYGIGLLEPVNTFRLRYKLDKNWQFQSETGVHSGADIIYTIER